MPRKKSSPEKADPIVLIQSEAKVTNESACEYWSRIHAIRNVREFFSALNIDDPRNGEESADRFAAFLISFFKLLGPVQQQAFYSWIFSNIRPALYAWGVVVPTPEEWYRDQGAIALTQHFFVAWAYGICKVPGRKSKVPKFVLDAMDAEGLKQW